jgi:hypothetical protein
MKDVLWSNNQWAVTKSGLESLVTEVEYVIPRDRLADVLYGTENVGMWPVQMVQKTWVDFDQFWPAYVKALELHAPTGREKIEFPATLQKVEQKRPTGERSPYGTDLG